MSLNRVKKFKKLSDCVRGAYDSQVFFKDILKTESALKKIIDNPEFNILLTSKETIHDALSDARVIVEIVENKIFFDKWAAWVSSKSGYVTLENCTPIYRGTFLHIPRWSNSCESCVVLSLTSIYAMRSETNKRCFSGYGNVSN